MRKLRRKVARERMKKAGIRQINKNPKGLGSYFADHWREFV